MNASWIEGNEKPNRLAKDVTRPESEEPPERDGYPWYLVKQALKRAEIMTEPLLRGRVDFGKFMKKIATALRLGKAGRLYQQFNSAEAAIFMKLRTDKTSFEMYRYKIILIKKASRKATLILGPRHPLALHDPKWLRKIPIYSRLFKTNLTISQLRS